MNEEYPIFEKRRQAVVYANQHGLEPYQLPSGLWSVREPAVPDPTKEELYRELEDQQDQVCYEGIKFVKSGEQYAFRTTTKDRERINSQMTAFLMGTDTEVDWIVGHNNGTALVTIMADQFKDLSVKANKLNTDAMAVFQEYSDEVAEMTPEQLVDKEYIAGFRSRAAEAYEEIPHEEDIKDALTLTAVLAGSVIRLAKIGNPADIAWKYSLDDGHTWEDYIVGTSIVLEEVGTSVQFKGTTGSLCESDLNFYKFYMDGQIDASGRLESLINYQEPSQNCFYGLFSTCTALTSLPYISSKTLAPGCLHDLFWGCTSANSIRVSFTEWLVDETGASATEDWLHGVNGTGTFICPEDLEEIRGPNGIPEGWNIVRV